MIIHSVQKDDGGNWYFKSEGKYFMERIEKV